MGKKIICRLAPRGRKSKDQGGERNQRSCNYIHPCILPKPPLVPLLPLLLLTCLVSNSLWTSGRLKVAAILSRRKLEFWIMELWAIVIIDAKAVIQFWLVSEWPPDSLAYTIWVPSDTFCTLKAATADRKKCLKPWIFSFVKSFFFYQT